MTVARMSLARANQPERPTLEELRGIDLFDELDEEQLKLWQEVAVIREEPADTVIAEPGEGSSGAFLLLLEGVVQGLVVEAGRVEPVMRQVAPTWMGAITVLTETGFAGQMRAETDVRMAVVDAEDFTRLVLSQRPVHRRIMRAIRPVATRIAAREQNRERLASLGTMAAGLAHELNNPATAARRAASDLADSLDVLAATIGLFVESGIERDQAEQLVAMQRDAVERAASRDSLSALDASDAEDELLEALERLGVPEPWRVTEPLVGRRDRCGVAGPARGRRGRCVQRRHRVDRRDADRARAGGRDHGVDRADVASSSRRSSRTRSWTAASSSRPTSTRASRRR